MAIDTRAIVRLWTRDPQSVSWNIDPSYTFTVIDGSISDSSVMESGIITTSGYCVLDGAARINTGDRIYISYRKNHRAASTPILADRVIPRILVCEGTQYDPTSRQTSVKIGCLLHYRRGYQRYGANARFSQEREFTFTIDPFGDPDPTRLRDERFSDPFAGGSIALRPIPWSRIIILLALNLGFSKESGTLDLSFVGSQGFSQKEFEFTSPNLSMLSDFYTSMNVTGYLSLNSTGVPSLEAVKLYRTVEPTDVPLRNLEDFITAEPVTGTESVPSGVITQYSHLKLRPPDNIELFCDPDPQEEEEEDPVLVRLRQWRTESSYTYTTGSVVIPYGVNGQNFKSVFTTLQTTRETSTYGPSGVTQRTTIETQSLALAAGAYITAWLGSGQQVSNYLVNSTVTENYAYDEDGNEVLRELTRLADAEVRIGAMNLPYTFTDPVTNQVQRLVINRGITGIVEKVTVNTTRFGNLTRTVTRRWVPWLMTIPGQQSIAEARDTWTSLSEVVSYVNDALSIPGLTLLDVTVNESVSVSGELSRTERDETAEVNSLYADENTANPDNGFRTENEANSVLTGSSVYTGLFNSYSLPYAPDDIFRPKEVIGSSPRRYCYYSVDGGAGGAARAFGLVRQRLAIGAANSLSVQLAPELLPHKPLDFVDVNLNRAGEAPVYVRYRVDASTWTFDSNGMVASADLLFWGTLGR